LRPYLCDILYFDDAKDKKRHCYGVHRGIVVTPQIDFVNKNANEGKTNIMLRIPFGKDK